MENPRRIDVQITANTDAVRRALDEAVAAANRTLLQLRLREARRRLIRTKYALCDAYAAGATPAEVCEQLGRPWTPELLARAFPDVERQRLGAAEQ